MQIFPAFNRKDNTGVFGHFKNEGIIAECHAIYSHPKKSPVYTIRYRRTISLYFYIALILLFGLSGIILIFCNIYNIIQYFTKIRKSHTIFFYVFISLIIVKNKNIIMKIIAYMIIIVKSQYK